mmetsp:Transcript_12821/g.26180  ORF Transcript_12821/g.26180 Transcript_12821/m.26180 type:complete len:251 (+) Transcript_12821:751-1503(+)
MTVRTDDVVSFAAQLYESLVSLRRIVPVPTHDVCHFLCKYKRRPLSLESHFLLEVSEEMSEVNMEQLSRFRKHNVTVVAITDTEVVCCHTVACCALDESLLNIFYFLASRYALFSQVFVQSRVVKRTPSDTTVLDLNVRDRVRVQNHFDHPDTFFVFVHTGGNTRVRRKFQVYAFRSPEGIHQTKHLQGKDVLTQVIARLEYDEDLLWGGILINIFEDKPEGQLLRAHEFAFFREYAGSLDGWVQGQLQT